MLKTLMSNQCTNNCLYCPFRATVDVRRCTIAPEEIATTYMDYQRQHNLHGLFLSSGVIRDPETTMDRMVGAAQILRKRHSYRGFIHLKVIPGASDAAVEAALSVASAVSVNIEVPGESHCRKVSETKDYLDDIIRPMKLIGKLTGKGCQYRRVRQTTQFIVGASDETDHEIIRYTSALYERLGLNRIYFSAYQRGLGGEALPGEQRPKPGDPLTREHRLYQVDFLLRKYGFKGEEIPLNPDGSLSMTKDPKQHWAEQHPEHFPIRLNSAPKSQLLRVPGLGPTTAARIIKVRKNHCLRGLHDVGVKGKRLGRAAPYVVSD